MPKSIEQIFPLPQKLLELESEEVAPFVLEWLCDKEDARNRPHRYNDTLQSLFRTYSPGNEEAIAKAIMEAWNYLERLGLIGPLPGDQPGHGYYVTKRGRKLREKTDFEKYSKGDVLNLKQLDPLLADKVYPLFLRGDYDTAVFIAFREVEIRVRQAASLPNSSLGVDMIRKEAFKPKTGILTDTELEPAEQQAMMNLFAGALGLYKNPPSHRYMDIDDPNVAAEMISFASHLLRIVENRKRIIQS